MTYSTLEKEILQLINQHRTQQGLIPLTFEDNIQEVSMEHSNNMATKKTAFGHDGFQQRAAILLSGLNGVGAAENVAMGQRSAQEVVASWLNSPGHRQNIEGDFNLTGIAVATNAQGEQVFTQIFIKAKAPKVISNDPPSTFVEEQASVEVNLNYSIFKLINQYRESKQLPSLKINPHIQVAATQHAQAMASQKTPFGHEGFEQRANQLLNKIEGSSVAENVAMGQKDAAIIVNSWLNSDGHRQNIEGDFNLTGIGIAHQGETVYYCQIFIKK